MDSFRWICGSDWGQGPWGWRSWKSWRLAEMSGRNIFSDRSGICSAYLQGTADLTLGGIVLAIRKAESALGGNHKQMPEWHDLFMSLQATWCAFSTKANETCEALGHEALRRSNELQPKATGEVQGKWIVLHDCKIWIQIIEHLQGFVAAIMEFSLLSSTGKAQPSVMAFVTDHGIVGTAIAYWFASLCWQIWLVPPDCWCLCSEAIHIKLCGCKVKAAALRVLIGYSPTKLSRHDQLIVELVSVVWNEHQDEQLKQELASTINFQLVGEELGLGHVCEPTLQNSAKRKQDQGFQARDLATAAWAIAKLARSSFIALV